MRWWNHTTWIFGGLDVAKAQPNLGAPNHKRAGRWVLAVNVSLAVPPRLAHQSRAKAYPVKHLRGLVNRLPYHGRYAHLFSAILCFCGRASENTARAENKRGDQGHENRRATETAVHAAILSSSQHPTARRSRERFEGISVP